MKDGVFTVSVICVIGCFMGVLLYIWLSCSFVVCVVSVYLCYVLYVISMFVVCKLYLWYVVLVISFVGFSVVFTCVVLIFIFDVYSLFL